MFRTPPHACHKYLVLDTVIAAAEYYESASISVTTLKETSLLIYSNTNIEKRAACPSTDKPQNHRSLIMLA